MDKTVALLLKNMTKLDVLSKYTENIRLKVQECWNEHLKMLEKNNISSDTVVFHLGTINLILDDMDNIIETAFNEYTNSDEEEQQNNKKG